MKIIESLVSQGYLETDSYDFKAELRGKDPAHNRRLTATACAFANTKGGFLIFGIRDLGDGKTTDRVEGIEADSDLAKEFGDRIRGASPNILFEFGNPPLRTKNSNKVVFVVHIPLSPNRPHATSNGTFYYRTNEGNRVMSYDQVRDGFLRYEERRSKIKLLLVELATLEGDAKATIVPPPGYSLATLDVTVLSSILPDVYGMIQDDTELVKDLVQIRRIVSRMNSKIRELASLFGDANAYGLQPFVEANNREMESHNQVLLPAIERVIKKLETKFGLKRPF